MVESALPFPKRAALDFAYEENESQMKKNLWDTLYLLILWGEWIFYTVLVGIYIYI